MRNKILLPIASAVLASALVFTVPAQAEENLATTTASEVYQEEVTTGLENTIIEEVYEDQAGVENEEANEVVEESEVVAPDSFLYNFKIFIEEVKLFFTFDDEKKAELLALLANERLLEADFAAEKGDLELVKELIKAYEEKVAALEELTKEAESVTDDTYDSVIEETYGVSDDVYGSDEESEETLLIGVYKYKLKNIEALTMVYNKVPDHVKPIIQKNLQKAIEKRDAHIAKKLEKQSKKAQKATDQVTEDVISEDESAETNDQAIVEVNTESKVEDSQTESKNEKRVEKKDYEFDDTDVNDDEHDSDNSKDYNKNEGKSKGKGDDNRNNKNK